MKVRKEKMIEKGKKLIIAENDKFEARLKKGIQRLNKQYRKKGKERIVFL